MRGIQNIVFIFLVLTFVLPVQSPGITGFRYVEESNKQGSEEFGILTIESEDLLDSDPIVLDGDEDFDTQGFPGSGSESDPYIIDGLHINLNETPSSYAISVSNTMSYFVIQNCLLQGENYIDNGYNFSSYDGDGIYFESVANAKIYKNTFLYTQTGIAIYSSENLTIEENYFPGVINEYTGVMGMIIGWTALGTCNNINITSNTLENCDGGIRCEFGVNYNISDNVLVNSSGIRMNWINQSVIMRNFVENGGYGISMQGVHSNLITENNLTRCRSTGIYVISGFNCTVHQNICTENGISLERGSEGGITTYGSHINVTWNSLIDNIRNALDGGEDNVFEYNYWSDYNGTDANGDEIGDVPYEIPGTAQNTDPFPRGPFVTPEPDMSLFILVGIGALGAVVIIVVVLFIRKK